MISALRGEGLDKLLETIAKELPPTRKRVELLIPYAKGSDAAALRRDGVVIREEYRDDGLYMEVICDIRLLETMKGYIL